MTTATIRARAFRIGYQPSATLTATYVIETGPPPGDDPPPDPATVAPELPAGDVAAFDEAMSFLFHGTPPLQREADATAVGREGVRRWFRVEQKPEVLAKYEAGLGHETDFSDN